MSDTTRCGLAGTLTGPLTSQAVQAGVAEALLPAGDGTGGDKQDRSDGGPGIAFAQEQEDMGTAAELGVFGMAVEVQQGLAFLCGEYDSGVHGLVSEVSWRSRYHPP